MRPGDEVVGRYRLDELHGHGPMSEVWRARDRKLDRTIALKILSPAADLGRFRREARTLATLAHENVMRVYDYGEGDYGPFMALEWLPGGTLQDRLGPKPLPAHETRRVAAGIAAGLAHLHSRGLVHRDLKPANVLFDEDGRPKLGDFGLARRTAGSGTLTGAGTVLGTAAYISPEQAAGEPAGAGSDVYSFGVILFRMLTGALPFAADDALALANMHRHVPAPAVETLQPDTPPELAALTAAALRKDPVQRPADGAALLDALGPPAAYSAAEDTQATQVLSGQAPTPAGSRRGRAAVAGAVVLLTAAGGALAWGVTRTGGSAVDVRSSSGPATGTHTRGGAVGTRSTPVETTGSQGRRSRRHGPAHTTGGRTTTPPTTTQAPPITTTPTTPPTTTQAPPTTTVPTTVPTTTTSGVGTTTATTGTT